MDKQDLKQHFKNILDTPQAEFLSSKEIKEKALAIIEIAEFPSRKMENWKYTNIEPILSQQYQLFEPQYFEEIVVEPLAENNLVFVNGFFAESLLTIQLNPDEIIFENINLAKNKYPRLFENHYNKTNIHEKGIFESINTAFSTQGVFIHVKKNQHIDKPIHISNIVIGEGKNILAQTRNLIIVEENAQVEIIETYHSIGKVNCFSNIVTEIFCKENSNVQYNRIQDEEYDSRQINSLNVNQAQDSSFFGNLFSLTGKMIRNNSIVNLQGENCTTQLNGLYLPTQENHVDNYTYIRHSQPHCSSNQIFKGIMNDQAHGVFYGLVYVAKDAQKTDAFQSNKNILITENAKMNSKPQLEIYADDVKCSHGSTTGQLDSEALFYLQARGIGKDKAMSMLLNAFASEIIENLKDERLKEYLSARITERYE